MSTVLYGCLFIPDFHAAVLLRGERNRTPPAVAVVTGEPPNQFVYAVNQPARQGGIQPGMPLAEAQARYSFSGQTNRLCIEKRDSEAEQLAQQDLLQAALNASPNIEDAAPGLILLDFTGLPNPHHSAARLSYRTEKLGLESNVAVSQNRFVALCAARTQPGVTHIFPGQEAGFLQAQPLDALPLDSTELETLARWGMKTIGDLARLPKDSLVARFGSRGVMMAKLSRGEHEAVLHTYEPPPELEERQDLDWLVGEIEPLSFLLSGLLERLCLKLQGYNLAAAKIRVSLKLADGSRFERSVALSYPLHDSRTLLTLLRLDLAAHPPGDAIEGVAVSAQPAERRLVQFSLFEPDLPSPEKLAVTLMRLKNLVGPDRIGAPVAPDTHRPGACAVAEFHGGKSPVFDRTRFKARKYNRENLITGSCEKIGDCHKHRPETPNDHHVLSSAVDCPPIFSQPSASIAIVPKSDAPVLSRQTLTFRCFRPPMPAEVLLCGSQPAHVNSPEVSGPVRACVGPWHVSGEWWTAGGWQYEEWDVEVRQRLYRIFCEQPAQVWYVAGGYD
jgi:protein ImuB